MNKPSSLEQAGLMHPPWQQSVPLREMTSIRTGGPARWYLPVQSAGEAVSAWLYSQRENIPVLLMGNASNLLIADEGFPGLVIHFGPDFSGIGVEGDTITAQAGVTLKTLAFFAADHHLAGLAFAAGIPGSLGGALMMNAGAYNGEMSQVVERVDCVNRRGEPVVLAGEAIGFGYRHSRMMDEGLMVLGAKLKLAPGSREGLYATMAEFQSMRREKQPLALPSAGSFFKRPPGYFAGALIEQAGLKGLRVGGAQVSEKHAGFLVNTGGATTADFIALKNEVQKRVMEKFGVALEPEVRIIPWEGA